MLKLDLDKHALPHLLLGAYIELLFAIHLLTRFIFPPQPEGMQWGTNLPAKASERRVATEEGARVYFRQMVAAVEHAHKKNIFHRGLSFSAAYLRYDQIAPRSTPLWPRGFSVARPVFPEFYGNISHTT